MMRFIFLPVLVFLTAPVAQASIIKLLKKRKVVVIDDSDVNKGTKVCFYDEDKKKACGRVVKVKEDKSYVKVKSKKRFRRLKKGMSHEIVSASGSTVQLGADFVFRLVFTPSILPRSKFSYLSFNSQHSDKDGSMFKAISDDQLSAGEDQKEGISELTVKAARYIPWASLGLEGEVAISKSVSLAVGARYTHLFLSQSVDSDFAGEEYMNSKYTGSELSFWLDCYFLGIKSPGIRIGAGAGMTMANLDITTHSAKGEGKEKQIDENKVIYSGKSTANIVSLRVVSRKDFKLGDFGVGLGANIIVSPVSFGGEFKIDEIHGDLQSKYKKEGDDEAKKAKAEKDITNALAHGNNIFSFMLSASVYFGI